MSYQVLARKWRPRFFDEMVGQEHVLRALINALNKQQLHHAYLFTGTRGVGKTTIARILAKCLNCEQGISARPCGECSACKEIAEGRFVDLIEVDAASRTKVEDTRELLDNVQYAPTRGRFKVYLIDEVHMLSSHSFNALLKTLEEPPAHVKFLLATTDPQKLPITVLSRCLQFNLKNMAPQQVVEHLTNVLNTENIPFEDSALWQLGRAAQGSMRDALSLTDQAIAYGEGQVMEAQVNTMLGTMDRGRLFKLAELMAKADASELLNLIKQMAEQAVDYDEALQGLLSIWHRTALAQVVPAAIDNSEGERDAILQLAAAMQAEDVQLCYQIGVTGRKDLALAPDPRQGFEMLMLRMLAFRPAPAAPVELDLPTALQKKKPLTTDTPLAPAAPALTPKPLVPSEEPLVSVVEPAAPSVSSVSAAPCAPSIEAEASNTALNDSVPNSDTWWQWYERLGLSGLSQAIAQHSALVEVQGTHFVFDVDLAQGALFNISHQDKLEEALRKFIPKATVSMNVQLPRAETPAQRYSRLKAEALAGAQFSLANDELVQQLIQTFDAYVIEESITPIN